MSLEDESFPTDELFKQLNDSTNSNAADNPISANYESPFLNSGCCSNTFMEPSNTSEKTCVSDPVGLDEADENGKGNERHTGRNHKTSSYQDIHSTYTKRRFKHVVSKVGQYIEAINAEDQERRNRAKKFQRHRSMPETLTPKAMPREVHYSAEELHKFNVSSNNSSGDEPQTSIQPDDSYDRMQREIKSIQSYKDYLEKRLYKEIAENVLLRQNFSTMRYELDDCKEKLKRQLGTTDASLNCRISNLNSLIDCPMSIATSTQTDFQWPPSAMVQHPESMYLAVTNEIADSEALRSNINMNHTVNDSSELSAGSIEVALASGGPATVYVNKFNTQVAVLKPISLDFSNSGTEAEHTGNVELEAVVSQPNNANRVVTNNSGSSHPSSNDSAIEVEGLDLRSPLRLPEARYRQQNPATSPTLAADANRNGHIYYFDKRNHRLVELMPLNGNISQRSNISQFSITNALSQANRSATVESLNFGRKRKPLSKRLLKFLGPCAKCRDPNQSFDANMTAESEFPLIAGRRLRENN